jgi:hypothetical protein
MNKEQLQRRHSYWRDLGKEYEHYVNKIFEILVEWLRQPKTLTLYSH